MGIGDMSIGKKVKKMAQLFFGRFDSYWGAVQGSDGAEDLADLLRRTVFQSMAVEDEKLQSMIAYFDAQSAHLFQQDEPEILRGRLTFLPADTVFKATVAKSDMTYGDT
jgi:cytochrome b pre-mRNA-processing protein 3